MNQHSPPDKEPDKEPYKEPDKEPDKEHEQTQPSVQSLRVADALLNDRGVYKNVVTMRHAWACIVERALAVKNKVKKKR